MSITQKRKLRHRDAKSPPEFMELWRSWDRVSEPDHGGVSQTAIHPNWFLKHISHLTLSEGFRYFGIWNLDLS